MRLEFIRREYLCGQRIDALRIYDNSYYDREQLVRSVHERKRFVVFFVTGCPGSLEFVTFFLEHLQKQLSKNGAVVDIHSAAHENHELYDTECSNAGTAHDYDFQVQLSSVTVCIAYAMPL